MHLELGRNTKFVKQIKVNELIRDAFIDFGSDVTLVKESLVSSLGVIHDRKESKGFGNSLVKCLGNIKLNFEIDGVKARVSCKIVKDNILDYSILVGQSFTELPHVLVYKNPNQLRLYNEGDLVKITRTSFDNRGKSKKLLPSYVGPFRVTRVLGNDRYKIKSIPGFSNMKHSLALRSLQTV